MGKWTTGKSACICCRMHTVRGNQESCQSTGDPAHDWYCYLFLVLNRLSFQASQVDIIQWCGNTADWPERTITCGHKTLCSGTHQHTSLFKLWQIIYIISHAHLFCCTDHEHVILTKSFDFQIDVFLCRAQLLTSPLKRCSNPSMLAFCHRHIPTPDSMCLACMSSSSNVLTQELKWK